MLDKNLSIVTPENRMTIAVAAEAGDQAAIITMESISKFMLGTTKPNMKNMSLVNRRRRAAGRRDDECDGRGGNVVSNAGVSARNQAKSLKIASC